MEYRDYNDNELLSYIKENNDDAYNVMFDKYKPLIKKIVHKFSFLLPDFGIDINDLFQEGMIGLNDAIRFFNEDKDVTFYTYAKTCIERRILKYISRYKNKSVSSMSLDFLLKDDYSLEDILYDDKTNLELDIIEKEKIDNIIKEAKNKLSSFEYEVFLLKIKGYSLKMMEVKLKKDYKSIDNAMQRIKKKLKDIK